MTVFGIGGCMALLLVGFGLRDSIMDVVLLQYGEIQLYDGMLVLNEDASDAEVEALKKDLSSRSDVEESMDVYMKKHAAKGENGTCEVYLMMPEKLENFFRLYTHQKPDHKGKRIRLVMRVLFWQKKRQKCWV